MPSASIMHVQSHVQLVDIHFYRIFNTNFEIIYFPIDKFIWLIIIQIYHSIFIRLFLRNSNFFSFLKRKEKSLQFPWKKISFFLSRKYKNRFVCVARASCERAKSTANNSFELNKSPNEIHFIGFCVFESTRMEQQSEIERPPTEYPFPNVKIRSEYNNSNTKYKYFLYMLSNVEYTPSTKHRIRYNT